MEQNQDHQRHTAAHKFETALDQLEGILQEIPIEEEVMPELHPARISDDVLSDDLGLIDLAAFEEAVADIEQYLEEKTKKK